MSILYVYTNTKCKSYFSTLAGVIMKFMGCSQYFQCHLKVEIHTCTFHDYLKANKADKPTCYVVSYALICVSIKTREQNKLLLGNNHMCLWVKKNVSMSNFVEGLSFLWFCNAISPFDVGDPSSPIFLTFKFFHNKLCRVFTSMYVTYFFYINMNDINLIFVHKITLTKKIFFSAATFLLGMYRVGVAID